MHRTLPHLPADFSNQEAANRFCWERFVATGQILEYEPLYPQKFTELFNVVDIPEISLKKEVLTYAVYKNQKLYGLIKWRTFYPILPVVVLGVRGKGKSLSPIPFTGLKGD